MMSLRKSFTIANMRKIKTTRNGDAATMVTFWRLFNASSLVNNSTKPTAAVSTPQIAESQGAASERPFWDIDPITVEAESAEVMKKVANKIIAMTAAMLPKGKVSSRLNNSASVVSPTMERPVCSK